MAEPSLDFRRETAQRTLIVIGIVILALFIWKSLQAFLLLFAAGILAAVLGGIAIRLRRWTHMPYQLALGIVVLLILGIAVGIGFALVPQLMREVTRIAEEMPKMIEEFRKSQWGHFLWRHGISPFQNLQLGSDLFSQVTGVAWLSAGFFTSMVLVMFLSLFISASPGDHREGLLTLLPPEKRDKGRTVLNACSDALWKWLIAQMLAMLTIGTLVTVSLSIVDAPYPWTIGILAGIFQFVPYVGLILWMIPAIVLGFSAGLPGLLKVFATYAVAQLIESNIVTPILTRREVKVPPVITLLSTMVFGLVFGLFGLIIATPIVVVLLVLYNQVFRRDVYDEEDASLIEHDVTQ